MRMWVDVGLLLIQRVSMLHKSTNSAKRTVYCQAYNVMYALDAWLVLFLKILDRVSPRARQWWHHRTVSCQAYNVMYALDARLVVFLNILLCSWTSWTAYHPGHGNDGIMDHGVGQNHIYTVYIRLFGQGNNLKYGHIRWCVYTYIRFWPALYDL